MKPATLLLSLAIVLAYLVELAAGGDAVCQAHGLVAARPTVQDALGSLFLHDPSSWVHVGGNAVFLLVFGTLVERSIGSVRLLVLYFAAGLGGAACHVLVDPSATMPLVGASGAIFGVLAAAAMLRPATLVFVVVFFGFNIVGLFAPELVGMHGVSVGAHVGGFVTGFVMVRTAFVGKIQEVTS